MPHRGKYLAIILNRNLGKVCDALRSDLLSKGIQDVVVIDSSTDQSLQSKFVTIGAVDQNAIEHGYRINRGFNLGLNYALENYEFDWIFCLPVDTKIIDLDLDAFDMESVNYPKIMAYTLNLKIPFSYLIMIISELTCLLKNLLYESTHQILPLVYMVNFLLKNEKNCYCLFPNL
jgi:hypothetical protein